jgi:hypothetical protein
VIFSRTDALQLKVALLKFTSGPRIEYGMESGNERDAWADEMELGTSKRNIHMMVLYYFCTLYDFI